MTRHATHPGEDVLAPVLGEVDDAVDRRHARRQVVLRRVVGLVDELVRVHLERLK